MDGHYNSKDVCSFSTTTDGDNLTSLCDLTPVDVLSCDFSLSHLEQFESYPQGVEKGQCEQLLARTEAHHPNVTSSPSSEDSNSISGPLSKNANNSSTTSSSNPNNICSPASTLSSNPNIICSLPSTLSSNPNNMCSLPSTLSSNPNNVCSSTSANSNYVSRPQSSVSGPFSSNSEVRIPETGSSFEYHELDSGVTADLDSSTTDLHPLLRCFSREHGASSFNDIFDATFATETQQQQQHHGAAVAAGFLLKQHQQHHHQHHQKTRYIASLFSERAFESVGTQETVSQIQHEDILTRNVEQTFFGGSYFTQNSDIPNSYGTSAISDGFGASDVSNGCRSSGISNCGGTSNISSGYETQSLTPHEFISSHCQSTSNGQLTLPEMTSSSPVTSLHVSSGSQLSVHDMTFSSPLTADIMQPVSDHISQAMTSANEHSSFLMTSSNMISFSDSTSSSSNIFDEEISTLGKDNSNVHSSTPLDSTFTSPTTSCKEMRSCEDTTSSTSSITSCKEVTSSGVKCDAAAGTLPPCRVCGGQASGFHYGANSCDACKGFFRRALRRKRNYVCSGNKNCPIRGQRRISCAYCRYQRCLAVGMSKQAIKIGRYTSAMRAHNTEELRMLQAKGDDFDLSDQEVDAILRDLMHAGKASLFSAEDYSPEEILRKQQICLQEYLSRKQLMGSLEKMPPEVREEMLRSSGVDIDDDKFHLERHADNVERYVRRYIRFGKGVPGFKELSLDDQANLLKTARIEIWFLAAYPGYNNALQVAHFPNGKCIHYGHLAEILGMDHILAEGALAGKLRRYSFTPEEMVVIKAICLMSTDRCPLERPEKVDKIQWLLTRCLLRLFERRCPARSRQLLTEAIEALVICRDLKALSDIENQKEPLKTTYSKRRLLEEVILMCP